MSLVLLLTLSLTAAPERVLLDRVVAVVNDEVITQSELDAMANPFIDAGASAERRHMVQTASIDQMIAEKLLDQQIREARIEVTTEDIERTIEDICRQNNLTKEQLQEAIESRGMSMVKYRSDLEKQLVRLKIVDLKVRSRVNIGDADVKAEWERQVGHEKREKMVKLRHVFFRWGEDAPPAEKKRVLARALEARQRALSGEAFAEVAKQISEGPTATDGGDLGWLSGANLLPEMARAVGKMSVGEISQPIETVNGVHVVLLEENRLKEPTGFEEAKNAIRAKLYQDEVEAQMKAWLDEVRRDSSVIVKLN